MTYQRLSFSILFLQIIWLLHCYASQTISRKTHLRYPDVRTTDFSRHVVLDVSQNIVSADCTNRPSVIINGRFPGPELRFKAGDKVKITVRNHLPEQNTTIHFHGISQFGSPFSDGTEKVSQFAIPAGGSYDYIFFLDSPGTYIYHAHVGFHLTTCHGAFIVEDIHPIPFRYDSEIVLLFADYYHATDHQIEDGLNAAPFKWLGEPQSLVVNGDALGTCNSTSAYGCSTGCHHHVITVKPSMTYRVRVIGITALTYVYFGIESHHDLSVIEVDGGYVRPASTSHMQLHSGQRYSFLLKTKSLSELAELGSKNDFWARLETRWRPTRDQGAFVIRYDTESTFSSIPKREKSVLSADLSLAPLPNIKTFSKLVSLPDEQEKWLNEEFKPLDPEEVAPTSSEVTRRIIISGQQIKASDGHINWFVNRRKYEETQPKIPFLVKAYTTNIHPNYEASNKSNGLDHKLGAYLVKLGDVVEFVIINQASLSGQVEAHPWHLHGKKFYVIAQGTGEFSDSKLAESEARFNQTHIARDTEILLSSREGASYSNTTVPAGSVTGWLVVRLKADDPGAFLFHCHIQPHAAMGMGAVILMGIDKLPPLPPGYLKYFGHSYACPPRYLLGKAEKHQFC